MFITTKKYIQSFLPMSSRGRCRYVKSFSHLPSKKEGKICEQVLKRNDMLECSSSSDHQGGAVWKNNGTAGLAPLHRNIRPCCL